MQAGSLGQQGYYISSGHRCKENNTFARIMDQDTGQEAFHTQLPGVSSGVLLRPLFQPYHLTKLSRGSLGVEKE